MAIVQISRITNRRGLQKDLPQLAPGELGWCIDTRLLFIGNGLLEEGSPAIGNTEVLTEFSDIKRLVEQLEGPLQFNIAGDVTLLDDQEIPVDSEFFFPNRASSLKLEYQIKRGGLIRFGTMSVVFNESGVDYSDEYTESEEDIGVELFPVISGGSKRIQYTTTATGEDAKLVGSIRYFI